MAPVTLRPLDVQGADRADFVRFLTQNTFPFHSSSRPTKEDVLRSIGAGRYDGDDHATFWIEERDIGRIGVAILEDLTDNAPLFDLRLGMAHRATGFGVLALRALTAQVFTSYPAVTRLEGNTRDDNIAMRKTFLRCGFLKEAHYRKAWPMVGGTSRDTVAYGILRKDWERGTVTMFTWGDDPE